MCVELSSGCYLLISNKNTMKKCIFTSVFFFVFETWLTAGRESCAHTFHITEDAVFSNNSRILSAVMFRYATIYNAEYLRGKKFKRMSLALSPLFYNLLLSILTYVAGVMSYVDLIKLSQCHFIRWYIYREVWSLSLLYMYQNYQNRKPH